jgi:hypothetical protein
LKKRLVSFPPDLSSRQFVYVKTVKRGHERQARFYYRVDMPPRFKGKMAVDDIGPERFDHLFRARLPVARAKTGQEHIDLGDRRTLGIQRIHCIMRKLGLVLLVLAQHRRFAPGVVLYLGIHPVLGDWKEGIAKMKNVHDVIVNIVNSVCPKTPVLKFVIPDACGERVYPEPAEGNHDPDHEALRQ